MKCPNCLEELPENAKICRRCETDVREYTPPSKESLDAITDFMAELPVEQKEEVVRLTKESKTAEEFADALLVGKCPSCGSSNVGGCENDPDYMDIFLGRCFGCGAVWCTECQHVLHENEDHCPRIGQHLEDMNSGEGAEESW